MVSIRWKGRGRWFSGRERQWIRGGSGGRKFPGVRHWKKGQREFDFFNVEMFLIYET